MATNPLGFVLPIAALGLGSIIVKPRRRGFFKAGTKDLYVRLPQATIEEVHHDELEITDHPVEQQAAITDHAFKRPAEVIITCGWSNSATSTDSLPNQAIGVAAAALGTVARTVIGAATTAMSQSLLLGNNPESMNAIYDQLIQLQAKRVLFDVYTGKRSYTNMLLKTLSVTTDKKTENALIIRVHCRQIIIVQTSKVAVVPINVQAQAQPQNTTPITEQGRRQLVQPAFTVELIEHP